MNAGKNTGKNTAKNTDGGSDRGGDRSRGRGAVGALAEHEVRTALLGLLAEADTVTATEAAARLGYSSGLCSFHLRQLARYGLIEEAPHRSGRARPWRLRQRRRQPDTDADSTAVARDDEFGVPSWELEDESYRRWLDHRGEAPASWRQDAAFSAVLYLTPEELRGIAAAVRAALAGFEEREHRPGARPRGAQPVAFISRLFPLLPVAEDDGR
ncbi:MAG TPA: helix-turn-helix domain-containing protein [Actinocrinis sp.]